MNDQEKEIEIYRQCMEQRKHYDLLSWSIGGGVLLIDGFILKWGLDNYNIHSLALGVCVSNIIGILLLVFWKSIYERNRMFVEVANELARDIERKWNIEGIGIRNGKYATQEDPKKVHFKNTNIDGSLYSSPTDELSKESSIHFGIRGIIYLISICHLLVLGMSIVTFLSTYNS